MKFKLEWYKRNLENMLLSQIKLIQEKESVERSINDLENRIELLHYQILEAEKAGIKEFDREKFRIKRKTNQK